MADKLIIKKDELEGAPEAPVAPAPTISLNDIASKLDQVISLLTQAAPPAAREVLAAKAEGAPEGTMDAGSGEGDKKPLPEDIAEKTHEEQPGKQAG